MSGTHIAGGVRRRPGVRRVHRLERERAQRQWAARYAKGSAGLVIELPPNMQAWGYGTRPWPGAPVDPWVPVQPAAPEVRTRLEWYGWPLPCVLGGAFFMLLCALALWAGAR